jgi:hypothetical protein
MFCRGSIFVNELVNELADTLVDEFVNGPFHLGIAASYSKLLDFVDS